MPFRGIPLHQMPKDIQKEARAKILQSRSNSVGWHTFVESMKISRRGENNPNWKGDKVKRNSGQARARRNYSIRQPCEACGNPKGERHHKDGDVLNNESSNIQWLCRACHMRIDDRIHNLRNQ